MQDATIDEVQQLREALALECENVEMLLVERGEILPTPGFQRAGDRGPQRFMVGIIGGFVLGILTAVSLGWWPL